MITHEIETLQDETRLFAQAFYFIFRVGRRELFEKEITCIYKKGPLLCLSDFFYPCSPSGQTAKTNRRSSSRTGIDLAVDIVAVNDHIGLRRIFPRGGTDIKPKESRHTKNSNQ
jgi:hypothetical protein